VFLSTVARAPAGRLAKARLAPAAIAIATASPTLIMSTIAGLYSRIALLLVFMILSSQPERGKQ